MAHTDRRAAETVGPFLVGRFSGVGGVGAMSFERMF